MATPVHTLQPVQQTNIRDLQRYNLNLLGAGAAAPTLGPGDSKNVYFTITRTAAGVYTLSTTEAYPGVAGVKAPWVRGSWLMAAPVATKVLALGVPTHNANYTWSFPISTFSSGAAADLAVGDQISLDLNFSKSTGLP